MNVFALQISHKNYIDHKLLLTVLVHNLLFQVILITQEEQAFLALLVLLQIFPWACLDLITQGMDKS